MNGKGGHGCKGIDWDKVEGIDDPGVSTRRIAERVGVSYANAYAMRKTRHRRKLAKAAPALVDAMAFARDALDRMACAGRCHCNGANPACEALDELNKLIIKALAKK